jgi:hypothetical protein
LFSFAHGSGNTYPITLDNNKISVTQGSEHVDLDIISYTSLDNFSYSFLKKIYAVTSMFTNARYAGFGAYAYVTLYFQGSTGSSFSIVISPYDFTNIKYEKI